ncbi:MAG TPA: metallophosphoesterase [Thermoplasmata archaeon]|nr:metallophosphoesterase [Thermoplasmata archaeon]
MEDGALPRSPPQVLEIPFDRVDPLLDVLEARVPRRAPIERIPAGREAIVFGDSHGDWPSVAAVVAKWEGADRYLIGLGDYVDRTPRDCPAGSLVNAVFLLSLAADRPDRVFLVQGNHETTRRMPVEPESLRREVLERWGSRERYDRLLGLLERGPLAVATDSGAYLAHGGFPRGPQPPDWSTRYVARSEAELADLVWAECTESRAHRDVVPPWTEAELDRFLADTGLAIVLRGHDPDLTGRPLYRDRCLTLHTTRVFERYGGVIVARLPLDRPVRSVLDLTVEHLATDGRTFPTG